MRSNWIFGIILLIFSFITLLSCDSDVANAGAIVLSDGRSDITVKSDKFGVISAIDSLDIISLTPDSFLLGECETNFGVIQADIFTQFACPEGFAYPDIVVTADGDTVSANSTVDSVCLYLYYQDWYGDGNSPIGVAVYELDKNSLSENISDIQLSDYCSLDDSTKINFSSAIVVPATAVDSAYSTKSESYIPAIRIRLSDKFAKRFFEIQEFSSQQTFNDLFKGLYICSDFGGSNVLYIKDMTMTVYYHFTLPRPGVKDSVINDSKSFYANEEVVQVNRYTYPNRAVVLEQHAEDTINYIVSPANIYTRLSISMNDIRNRIEEQLVNIDDYRVYVNKANLTVDVIYTDSATERPRDNWDKPASYMMLIKEDQLKAFFEENKLPSDTSAIVVSLSSSVDSSNKVSYYYTYNLSELFTQQLRTENTTDELNFALVPVSINSNSSTGQVTSVKQLQTITATRISSGIRFANDSTIKNPMDIEMVYSGFKRTR